MNPDRQDSRHRRRHHPARWPPLRSDQNVRTWARLLWIGENRTKRRVWSTRVLILSWNLPPGPTTKCHTSWPMRFGARLIENSTVQRDTDIRRDRNGSTPCVVRSAASSPHLNNLLSAMILSIPLRTEASLTRGLLASVRCPDCPGPHSSCSERTRKDETKYLGKLRSWRWACHCRWREQDRPRSGLLSCLPRKGTLGWRRWPCFCVLVGGNRGDYNRE